MAVDSRTNGSLFQERPQDGNRGGASLPVRGSGALKSLLMAQVMMCSLPLFSSLLVELKQTVMLLCCLSPAGNRSSHPLRSLGAAKGAGPSLLPGLETITTKRGIVWLGYQ